MSKMLRYGGYPDGHPKVQRDGHTVIARFDMTHDVIELSDVFAWLFKALEDGWDKNQAIFAHDTPRDTVKHLLVEAIDLFLFSKDSEKRLRDGEQFCDDLRAFLYESTTAKSFAFRHDDPD